MSHFIVCAKVPCGELVCRLQFVGSWFHTFLSLCSGVLSKELFQRSIMQGVLFNLALTASELRRLRIRRVSWLESVKRCFCFYRILLYQQDTFLWYVNNRKGDNSLGKGHAMSFLTAYFWILVRDRFLWLQGRVTIGCRVTFVPTDSSAQLFVSRTFDNSSHDETSVPGLKSCHCLHDSILSVTKNQDSIPMLYCLTKFNKCS